MPIRLFLFIGSGAEIVQLINPLYLSIDIAGMQSDDGDQSTVCAVIIGTVVYELMKGGKLKLKQLSPTILKEQFEKSISVHPAEIIPKKPAQNFRNQLCFLEVGLEQNLFWGGFDYLLEELHTVVIIGTALFVFVANRSSEAQLSGKRKQVVGQEELLCVPGFVIFTIHQQQNLADPIELVLFGISAGQHFDEGRVILLEKAMTDAEAFFLKRDLFIDELIGNVFDFFEPYLLDILSVNGSGLVYW